MNYQVSKQKFQKENRKRPKYYYKRLVELHSVVSGNNYKLNTICKQVTRKEKKCKDGNKSVTVPNNKRQKIVDDNGCNNNKENRYDNDNDTINRLYSSNITSPLRLNDKTTIPTVEVAIAASAPPASIPPQPPTPPTPPTPPLALHIEAAALPPTTTITLTTPTPTRAGLAAMGLFNSFPRMAYAINRSQYCTGIQFNQLSKDHENVQSLLAKYSSYIVLLLYQQLQLLLPGKASTATVIGASSPITKTTDTKCGRQK